MKDLMTRKIVLGMLMALVLAFSVQGIADAFTVTASSTSNEFIPVNSTGTALSRSFSFGITFTNAEFTGTSDQTVTLGSAPSGTTITSFTVSGLTDTDSDSTNLAVIGDPARASYTATVRYTLATGDTGLGVKSFTVGADTVHTAYGVRADGQNTFATLTPGTTSPQTGAESSGKEIEVTPSATWTKVTFSTTSGLLYSQGAGNFYVSGSKLVSSLTSGSRSITAYSNAAEAIEVQYRATGTRRLRLRQ